MKDCSLSAWMNGFQLHAPGLWVFSGRFLSACPIETVLLYRKEIFVSPEKAAFKSLVGAVVFMECKEAPAAEMVACPAACLQETSEKSSWT